MVLYDLPNILNMVMRGVENFLRAFQKKFWAKKRPYEECVNPILRVDFSKRSFFKFFGSKLFTKLLENFLRVAWPCSMYLEGRTRPYLYARKKLESYHTSNELYGRKRKKVWIFEKSTLRIGLRHAWKIHVFEVKIFFKCS